ncbi:Protein of unknown function (DUF3152) [Saccharomonospora glauca K62]|uniref:Peptidase metallopeptidase domain-containing protein n=1 Tax=Saccharomonospora glauca K62 TaxID=928724 RepID=I1CYB7_9PSEU|nr:Protein of unknown function (DUF3152) [Saccharomonospora glauca K62]
MWHSEAVKRVTGGVRKSDGDIASAGHDPADARGTAEADRPDDGDFDAESEGGRPPSEPLRASWRPVGKVAPERPRRSGLKKFTATYGWRAYLIPILLVVTALVVFDTTRNAGTPDGGDASGAAPSGGGDGSSPNPVATEVPAKQVDLHIPTAELPEGGDYDKVGKGQWHVVPLGENGGKKAGDSPNLYTYTVEVEDGLNPGSFAGDDSFASTVEATLSDSRSWPGTGEVSFQRVDDRHPDPDFRVSLTSPETTKQLCGQEIPFESSCYISSYQRVVINLARWVRGAKAFSGNMGVYQQYVINHEVGHALGNGHVGCPEDGALAPVMMQQTFGVANDYVAKLNDLPGGDQGAVPADGKVCLPNAWPVPQPKGE